MRTETAWTRRGQYNFVVYEPGERMEACGGSPIARIKTVVCWYPGKPTLVYGHTTLEATISALTDDLDLYESNLKPRR